MTVTELAHFHSRSGDLTPTLRDLAGWAVEAQDKWCADNLSNSTRYMANGTEARGVGCEYLMPFLFCLAKYADQVYYSLSADWKPRGAPFDSTLGECCATYGMDRLEREPRCNASPRGAYRHVQAALLPR